MKKTWKGFKHPLTVPLGPPGPASRWFCGGSCTAFSPSLLPMALSTPASVVSQVLTLCYFLPVPLGSGLNSGSNQGRHILFPWGHRVVKKQLLS